MTLTMATNKQSSPVRPPASGKFSVYPSSAVRGIPGFVFETPKGFELDEAPGALVVARTIEPVKGFWVNVIISHDRVAAGVKLEQAAQQTFAQLARQCPGLEVTDEKLGKFGERLTYLRSVEMAAPQSNRRLTQVHALFFAPQAGPAKTTDLFHIVGTCPTDCAEVFGPRFVTLIASFQFT